jgi:hypothetical protein
MNKKFIIEMGLLDNRGDLLRLDGLTIKDRPTMALQDFNAMKPLGQCAVLLEDGVLKADCKLLDNTDGYPAIGFSVEESEPNEHGGRTITKATLHYVGISNSPNADPNIKRISEQ